jgi:hypothetical protein
MRRARDEDVLCVPAMLRDASLLGLTTLACAAALTGIAAAKPPDTAAIEKELVAKHGAAHQERIRRGLSQAASLWRAEDGDLAAFAREHLLVDPATLDATFVRLETVFEQLFGHFNDIVRELRRASDVEVGPLLPIDPLFGGLDASAHVIEDLFAAKVGFAALLNFPLTTLEQRQAAGPKWTRRQWAEARLVDRFSRRVPPPIQLAIARAEADAELYIASYNLWLHHVLDEKGQRLFPRGLRLISHWNLRDELKAAYADPNGIGKQRVIVKAMERIVSQSIPAAVIDNPRVDWNPWTNAVTAAPAAEVEENAPAREAKTDAAPEPDVRYAKLLAHFRSHKAADPYAPTAPTAMARSFEYNEIPEERVVKLLTEVLESPLVPLVAAEIERRLGRKLEPQDLWYAGFQARGKTPEEKLDAVTRKRYPTADAFARDIPRILRKLGFPKAQVDLVTKNVLVDPSRGAGHALQATRRGEAARLRTRVEKGGMTYKGYNIAVHELGHNVEQVISLYEVDHTLLQGVPITAITEALAFVFQSRDLELLGLPAAREEGDQALNHFWGTWEIAGVALVEIQLWKWMYEHPEAKPAEVREAALRIARDLWNRYYAPVLGSKDNVLLGIYSHMLSTPLYLYNYPIGHLVAAQLEEHLAKMGRAKLGTEFSRMCRMGLVTPDLWMENATGAPLGTAALFRATEKALGAK